MSKNYENASFKKLLEKLQEESWQLELIISGFAIFGLFTAYPQIKVAALEAQKTSQIYSFIVLIVAQVSCGILILNLLLHVVLRGLWIGALGLRYVSGDIDYEVLNYSKKFTKYLKKRVGSFDRYIGKLENYCSIIFAISFLLIFYVLAFTFTIITIALIANYILSNDNIPEPWQNIIGIPLVLFVVFGMFITFIDFITQGWLKKKQWISKIYFPVYWVFSFITLSFLYRPLVYNFLDNKFGKRLSMVLIPVYFLILIGTSLHYKTSNYLSFDNNSSSIYANNKNYGDMLVDDTDFIEDVIIPSKVITDSYLNVFIVFNENVEDNVFAYNSSLKPENDERGLTSSITINSSGNRFNSRQRDSIKRVYIKTFNDVYNIRIDTTKYDSEFILSQNKKNDLGFETNIGIKGLTEGKHMLNVTRERVRNNDTTTVYLARIPFWYYRD